MGLLSGGQRQAATLLMATVAQPKLLLLDEHTAALDPGAAEKVMEVTEQIVARDKITTLMITHDMDYALSVGSRTIMLDAGRIVLDLQGTERENMKPGALAELYYARSRRKKKCCSLKNNGNREYGQARQVTSCRAYRLYCRWHNGMNARTRGLLW